MPKGRSKLGGNKTLTKNQAQKAHRAGQQADRLRNVTRWAEDIAEKKSSPVKTETKAKKARKINMSKRAIARRSIVLTNLLKQLERGNKILSTKGIVNIPYEIYSVLLEETATPDIILPLNVNDTDRIKKEIEVLKSRGATVSKSVVVL